MASDRGFEPVEYFALRSEDGEYVFLHVNQSLNDGEAESCFKDNEL